MNQSAFRTYTCRYLARENGYEQIVMFFGREEGESRVVSAEGMAKLQNICFQ